MHEIQPYENFNQAKYGIKVITYTCCVEDRDEKAYKYKLRVVTFMEQAADHPEEYLLPDEFNGGVKAKELQTRLLGRERFKFTNNSKDEERIIVRNKTVNSCCRRRHRSTTRSATRSR